MNRIPLSQVCNYSDVSVQVSELDLNNFISTDNMLPNRGGIVEAVNLPPANTCSAFTENEILISNIRPYFKKIWFAEFDGGCSADVLVLKNTNPKFDAKFVYYNLFQDLFFKHQMTGSKGSKMPRGDKDQIMTFLIPEFDKSYQKQIAEFLTVIDDKIALNKKINSELENLAKTIYNYWFVQFDFPNEEGKPYKTSGGEMEWNEELKREIPKGWEVDSLKRLFEIQSGYPFESEDYRNNGDYKLITIKNVQDGFLDTNETDFIESLPKNLPDYCKLKLGDLLMSLTGNVGRVCIVTEENLLLNQRVGVVIPQNQCLAFTYFTLQSDFIVKTLKKIATGSNQKNLSPIEAGEEKALQPDENIVKFFEKKTKPFFDMILKNQRENQELIKLRDFLLPMLMNGQVKVKSEAKEELSMAAEPQVKYGK